MDDRRMIPVLFALICERGTNNPVSQQYFELRSRQIQKLRESQSPNPYPHKFEVSRSLTSYIKKYGPKGVIEPGEKVKGITEALAGRIHSIRSSGQKLRFYDLHSEGKKVQIMATLQCVLANLSPFCIIILIIEFKRRRRPGVFRRNA